jgi:hypothetical protein
MCNSEHVSHNDCWTRRGLSDLAPSHVHLGDDGRAIATTIPSIISVMVPDCASFYSSAVADMLTEAPARENAPSMPSGDRSSRLVVASPDMIGSILHPQLRSLGVEGEVIGVVLASFKVIGLRLWQLKGPNWLEGVNSLILKLQTTRQTC